MTAEKQHNTQNCNTPMKEYFQLFFDICVKPLVEAINNHGYVRAGGTLGEVKPTVGETTAAEKPVKAAKTAKPAPASAPEPEPVEEAGEVISEARLKATVKTLPDADKLKLKAFFQKEFGYNTMAEIEEKNRSAIHAKAIALGATDTDPDALGDM